MTQTDATNVNFGGQQHPLHSVCMKTAISMKPSVDYYPDGITYSIDGIEVTEATYPSGFAGASPKTGSFYCKFQMMLQIKFITLIEL